MHQGLGMPQVSALRKAYGHLGNDRAGRLARFESAIVPHLGVAYKLARWLVPRAHDAEDVVQESCLRAFRFFGSFHGGDGRGWLLAIVRRTSYTWLQKNRARQPKASFDLERHDVGSTAGDPEKTLHQAEADQSVRDTLAQLPAALREVIELRALEGLSYKEIAHATGIPPGTVMSRLARARERLGQLLMERGVDIGGGDPTSSKID
jgi:RNA polymerase sigma-70 factor (ECF subfamily)